MKKNFDPREIVAALREHYKKNDGLVEKIEKLKTILDYVGDEENRLDCYYFVDSKNPNQLGSEWQYEETIGLVAWDEADIRIDILKDGRVGCIEILWFAESKPRKFNF